LHSIIVNLIGLFCHCSYQQQVSLLFASLLLLLVVLLLVLLVLLFVPAAVAAVWVPAAAAGHQQLCAADEPDWQGVHVTQAAGGPGGQLPLHTRRACLLVSVINISFWHMSEKIT
jgi:hypothetical protein